MGTEGPPELTQFLLERELYRELGWTDGLAAGARPWKQVQDYSLFISAIRREEQARASRRR